MTQQLLQGEFVFLRYPDVTDWDEWSKLRDRSRDFLTPWEPLWPVDDLTRTAFRRRLRRYQRDIRDDAAYPFFIFRKSDRALVGGITVSNVRRGVTQACSVGYWTGEAYARHGYMRDALRAVVRHAIRDLGFHRVEAACLPDNHASKSLLKQTGFTEEGYARKYLRINGAWQDHILFGIVESDFPLPEYAPLETELEVIPEGSSVA